MLRKQMKLFAGLLILLSASACGPSSAVSNFCAVATPIYTAPEDTEETKKQVDEHNAKGESLCSW